MPFIEQQLSADGVISDGRVVANKAILEAITNDHVLTMAVNAGGTGYAIGDTFRLNTGTPVVVNADSFHAVGRVVTLSGSAAATIEITSAGSYPTGTKPTVTGGATTTLTGAGSGLTIDTTTVAALWTEDSSDFTDLSTLFDWLCSSTKAANAPTIGGSSQLSASNDGIRLTIGSSYSGILPWASQPGSPPTNTFYLSVPNQDPKVYISTTERRVNVLITNVAGTPKQYAGAGLFIPYTDVAGNYPFPGMIHGQSTSVRANAETFGTSNRGLLNPIDFSGLGCYQYRNNLSVEWFGITADNQQGADVCKAQMWPDQGTWADWSLNYAPVPSGSSALASHMQPVNSSNLPMSFGEDLWYELDQSSAIGPAGPAPLGAGNQLHFTTQAQIASNQANDVQFIGFIDGFEHVHGRGLAAFDEIQNQDGRRYVVFPDTGSTSLVNWIAMEII